MCYLGNMGDTKAVLVKQKDKNSVTVESKTIEHKGTNLREQERVKQAGGTIIQNRVSGSLAVTRALGDLDLKKEVFLRHFLRFFL